MSLNTFLRFFREKVSGDKKRYATEKFDLDLTYITERIIAMAYPASGVERTYRNDATEVAEMLKTKHPGHFRVYNLTERDYDYSLFEDRVIKCGWFDHHAPPLSQLFDIIMDINSFLLEHPDNVVVIHCLAGKGRTGTVIICYLLYSGLFNDPSQTALYFANKRSVNNWGVTGPSQQRYIQYFYDVIVTKRRPDMSPLRLKSIIINDPPKFSMGGRKSSTPLITVVDVSGGLKQEVKWVSKGDKTIYDETDHILLEPEDLVLLGDMNITIINLGYLGRRQKIGRFAFNTGMLQKLNNGMYITRFSKSDIDDACNDKRTPHSFYIELKFEKVTTIDKDWKFLIKSDLSSLWNSVFQYYDVNCNGSICFNSNISNVEERISKAKELVDTKTGKSIEKGGYLTKRGHKIKNWKRRWFVLHYNTLEYYKSPKNSTPCGVIRIDDIYAVQQLDNDTISDDNIQNSFIIYTNWNDYVCYADNESEMEDWIDTINMAIQIKEKGELKESTLGQLSIKMIEVIKGKTDIYCIFDFGNGQKFKTELMSGVNKEIMVDICSTSKGTMKIELWEDKSYFINQNIAWCEDNISEIIDETLTTPLENDQWYEFKKFGIKIHLKMVYKPKAWIESQASKNETFNLEIRGGVTKILDEHEIVELIKLMDQKILLLSADPEPVVREIPTRRRNVTINEEM